MKSGTSKIVFVSLIAAIFVTGCGGGGGGSTPGATSSGTTVVTPIPVPVTVIQPANLVLVSPPTNYTVASEELGAFNTINNARVSCGFGALTQNAALDIAATGHSKWLLGVSSTVAGHTQTPGTVNFTGTSIDDRLTLAGYGPIGSYIPSEEGAANSYLAKTGYGAKLTKTLLNAPYHLASMMDGFRDAGVGLSVAIGVNGFNNRTSLVINTAYKTSVGAQLLAGDAVQTYPCEGVTGVDIGLSAETPNPVPGRDLTSSPIGMAIYVGIRRGNTLAISSASVTNTVTGNPEKVNATLSAKNDPNVTVNGSYFGSHQAVIFTDKPASANTKYSAVINGTNDGVAFTRTFAFTTGTGGLDRN